MSLLLRWILVCCMAFAPNVLQNFASAIPAAHAAPVEQNSGADYVPGVVLVGLPAAFGRGETAPLARALAIAGATGAEPLFSQSPERSAARAAADADTQIFRLRLVAGADVLAAAAVLRQGGATFAEPDYLARAASASTMQFDALPDIAARVVMTPNDPLFRGQWGLTRIEASAGWKVVTGTPGTTIAVIDSGVESSHADLASRLWVNPGEIAGNSVDDDLNGFVDDVNGWSFVDRSKILTDDYGQGTRVAGVAAAAGNNGAGIAGVCLNCRIMVLKVMKSGGVAAYSDIIAALNYAVAKGARVINLSVGGYAESAALRTAVQNASARAVVVAAAGDGNTSSRFYPAAYPDVLGVAATTLIDARLPVSNFGEWVSLAAPGHGITTTQPGNTYGPWAGSAVAAPFVAGLAALIRSQRPDWTPQQLRLQLLRTAKRLQAPGLGNGLPNAAAAVQNPQPLLNVHSDVNGVVNGRAVPGASAWLGVTIRNDWAPASGVRISLTTSSPYAAINVGTAWFGNMDYGQFGSVSLGFTTTASVGPNRQIPFSLRMTANNGSYLRTVPVTVTTRTIEEPACGTILNSADVSRKEVRWTNDKTYLVTCNVSVAPGYTLTIEPGTQVLISGTYTFTVNGTLIADGTAAAPIRFAMVDRQFSKLTSGVGPLCVSTASGNLYCLERRPGASSQLVRVAAMDGLVDSAASGYDFQCVRTKAGGAKCRGNNDSGQLGNGTFVSSTTLVDVRNMTRSVESLSAGGSHACMVGTDWSVGNGTRGVWCWGNNSYMQLGGAGNGNSSFPRLANDGLLEVHRAEVVAGLAHTCVRIVDKVKCWGNTVVVDPENISTIYMSWGVPLTNVLSLAASGASACAVTSARKAYCWGENIDGQLGSIGNGVRYHAAQVDRVTDVVKIAAGENHYCVLLINGRVACWGDDSYGQLGRRAPGPDAQTPIDAVVLATEAIDIGGGTAETCVLFRENAQVVLCWGRGMESGRVFHLETWGGLVFADTSVDAQTSAAGAYQRGSVLRHVQIGHSSHGIRCNNAAPYLSDVQIGYAGIDCAPPVTSTLWLLSSTIDGGVKISGRAEVVSTTVRRTPYAYATNGDDSASVVSLLVGSRSRVVDSSIVFGGLTVGDQSIISNTIIAAGDVEASDGVTVTASSVAGASFKLGNRSVVRGSLFTIGSFSLGSNVLFAGNVVSFTQGASLNAGANVTVTGNRFIGGSIIASTGVISDNLIADSPGDGLRVGAATVVDNTILRTGGRAVVLQGGLPLRFSGNNIVQTSGPYDLYVDVPGNEVRVENNWWGITSTNALRSRMFDWFIDSSKARAIFSPTLSRPGSAAPVYLQRIAPSQSPAGIGPITLTASFSGDIRRDPAPSMTLIGLPKPAVLTITSSSISGGQAHFVTDVNSKWPRGVYTISVAGAAGIDGIEMAPSSAFTFAVGYPSSVTDQTSPDLPVVIVGGNALTTLGMRLTSTDTQSSITHFRYAIGTTARGTDVVNWTLVPVSAPAVGGRTVTITRTGMSLLRGVTYYVSAEAQNAVRLWSPIGVSRPISISGSAALAHTENADSLRDAATPTISAAMESTAVFSPTATAVVSEASMTEISTTATQEAVVTGTSTVSHIVMPTSTAELEPSATPGPTAAGLISAPLVIVRLDASLTRIAVQWIVSDAQASVAAYRYALGSVPGGVDVMDWKTVEIMAERGAAGDFIIANDGPALIPGRSYYVVLQVMDAAGRWSPVAQAGPMALRRVYAPIALR